MNRNKLIAVAGVVVVAALVAFFVVKRGKRSERPSSHQTDRTGDKLATAKLPAPPQPVVVSGKVTSADDGAPIANAIVNLTDADNDETGLPIGALAARTGADGGFTITDVPPRRYSVAATAPGFLPKRIELSVAAATTGVDIALARGGNRLSGTVADVSGGAISGALVRVTPVHGLLSVSEAHGFAALSADDGSYSLHVADGRYRVTAAHLDYVAESQAIELRGGNRTLDFALAPGAVVEGVVLSAATGQPVAAATVGYVRESMMRIPGGAPMAMGGRGGVTTTDSAGKFRISGLQAGAIRLSARAQRGASREPTTVPIAIAEQVAGVEIYIAEAFTISGKVVVEEDGKPAAGVNVSAIVANGGERIPALATSSADGSFVIAGVQPGKYHLVARSDDFVADLLGDNVEVDAADLSDVVVTVRRGAFVTGRVDPPTVADVEIALTTGGDMPGPGRLISFTAGSNTVRTQADGAFRLGPLLAGDITLTGKAADGRKGTTPVSVPAAGLADVVIVLEGKASISGRVVDDKNQPVGDAIVSLKREPGERRVTMIINGRDATAEQSPTHEDGSFAISGLDAGDYELSVKDAQGQQLAWAKPADKKQPHAPRPITLADNEQRTGVRLAVEARNGVIRGVVLDPDGAPAADVWVTATPRLAFSAPAMPPPQPTPGEGDGEVREERVEVMTMVMVADDEEGGGGLGGGFGSSVAPVLTDDRGRFEITGLRHGDYDLMAEGMRGSARGFTKGVATGSEVSIRLLALTRIDGVVTLAGEPVERFHVALSGASHRAKDVRDSGGKFALHRVDPGLYTVEVTSDEGSGRAEVEVATGKVSEVEIELVTMARITGKVVTADGQPVVGAMVLLGAGGNGEMEISMVAGEEPARTGADGSFEVRAGRGKHLVLVLGEDSHQPLAMRPVEVLGADIDLGVMTADQ